MTRNRLNLRKVVAIAICLAGTVTFLGCDNNNNNPTTSVFTTIELRTYDNSEVWVFVRDEDGDGHQTIAQGKPIDNLVKLTFTDVSNEYLYNIVKNETIFYSDWGDAPRFISIYNIAELNISNPNARIAIAVIQITYNWLANGDYDVGFVYSNMDCDITGVTTIDSTPCIVDIHLRKGWNMVVRQGEYKKEYEYRISTTLVKGGTWYPQAD